jgi:hypothetical protein
MANRTFKISGSAYAPSGDVTVTVTVDGTQVYNGSVPTSATPREGQPTTQTEMLSFTMDESVVGDKSLQLDVSGGEFVMGNWQCNGAHNEIMDLYAMAEANGGTFSPAEQATIASTIGETKLNAQQAGLYNKLVAGTATNEDGADIIVANNTGDLNLTDYVWLTQDNDKKSSAQINGVAQPSWEDAHTSALNWLILQDGDTFTATWSVTPTDNWPNMKVA